MRTQDATAAEREPTNTPSRHQPAAAITGVLAMSGTDIAYEVEGEGPAVVLIHGFGLDMRMWEPQVECLAATYRVVRYDCRGFGATGEFDPAVPYTHADDLLSLLDHLGLDQAVLVGLSFGGRVAMHTALQAPSRVRALVLLDAVLDGVAWDPPSAEALSEVIRQVETLGIAGGRQAWMAHPLFAPASKDRDLAAALSAMVDCYPGQHWLGQDSHRPDPPSPIERLDEYVMPTMVVVGELDVPGFHEMADTMANAMPDAQHHIVPNAGHMVNMEAPEAINELLLAFLERVCRGSG